MAMADQTINLISNPGSASRKYALFSGSTCCARLHFEYVEKQVVCTIAIGEKSTTIKTGLNNVGDAASQLVTILQQHRIIEGHSHISHIGVRVVAPGSFFLNDHQITTEVIDKLEEARPLAPLHVTSSLSEIHELQKQFPHSVIYGISDSAFHSSKPDYAWNYGIPLSDADRLDIKRFGYHGLSIASVVRQLQDANKLAHKTIVAHLGGGVSITGLRNGKSADNSMGYSPLEGPIMATRSGTIDVTGAYALKASLGLDDRQLDQYLNEKGGLLGLGGSADIRELLQRESDGDHYAKLALNTYIYSIQKTIGSMCAALGGIEQLVFAGTVGERSALIRERIVSNLHYLDFTMDEDANNGQAHPDQIALISRIAHSKPIHIVVTDEASEMAKRINA